MAKQCLHWTLAMADAEETRPDVSWMLHIDGDELFTLPEGMTLDQHVDTLESAGLSSAVYVNHEALAERAFLKEGTSPFSDMTLFLKSSFSAVTRAQDAIMSFLETRHPRSTYFQGYWVGKYAGKLRMGQTVADVTRLFPAKERKDFRVGVFSSPVILHYINYDADSWFRKFKNLGDFPNVIYDASKMPRGFWERHGKKPYQSSMEQLTFHKKSRDVLRGKTLEQARQVYQRMFVLDKDLALRLRNAGVLLTFKGPMRVVAQHCAASLNITLPAAADKERAPPTIDHSSLASLSKPRTCKVKPHFFCFAPSQVACCEFLHTRAMNFLYHQLGYKKDQRYGVWGKHDEL